MTIINTYDQMQAAGGDRVAIAWQRADKWRCAGWHVYRLVNGRQVKTDRDAAWYDNGQKFFLAWHPVREGKPKALAEAIEWANKTYGVREFVRNKWGEYVEREVNERFPIARQPRVKRDES